MKNIVRSLALSIGVSAAIVLAGCTTVEQQVNPTQMSSQWINQDVTFEQKTITGILVVADNSNPTTKRLFEDIFSQTFTLNGIPAEPSYKYLTPNQQVSLPQGGLNLPVIRQAAKKAKASDVLLVSFNGTKTKTIYNPGVTWGPDPFWGGPFGPGPWGPGPFFTPDPFWGGWAIPPSVTSNQYMTSNVQLFLTKDFQTLWTASFSTLMEQFSSEKTIQMYAQLLVQKILSNGFMIPLQEPNYQIQAPVVSPQTTPVQ